MEQEIRDLEGRSEPVRKNYYVVLAITVLVIVAAVIGLVGLLNNNKRDSDGSLATTISEDKKDTVEEPPKKQEAFNWSTMNQGPYHDSISFATGTSLTKWADSGKVLAEHASVPDVVVKDGKLYVYFVDVSTDGIAEQIGLITSSDNGKTWSEKQIVSIKGLGDKIAVDPSPFLLDDGKIRLYYFDISTTKTSGMENNTIYSAISEDGINFAEEPGYRFRYRGIFDPCVVRVLTTDSTMAGQAVWRMYVGNGDGNKVYSATSTDGLTFNYEGVAFTGGAIPKVVYENGTYYLFTVGVEISTSKDGKTFTKTPNRFDAGKLTADPGVVKLSDGTYFMIYKTKDESTVAGNEPTKPKP